MGVLNEEKAKEEKVNERDEEIVNGWNASDDDDDEGEDQDSYEEKAEKELVKEIIEEQRIKHTRQFIPIYPPHPNAIEYCFGQWARFNNGHPRYT